MCPIAQSDAGMRHTGLARQGPGSFRCRQQSPMLSSLPHRSPPRSSESYPPPPPPISSRSRNFLRAEGATALSSGLTVLTMLESINVR